MASPSPQHRWRVAAAAQIEFHVSRLANIIARLRLRIAGGADVRSDVLHRVPAACLRRRTPSESIARAVSSPLASPCSSRTGCTAHLGRERRGGSLILPKSTVVSCSADPTSTEGIWKKETPGELASTACPSPLVYSSMNEPSMRPRAGPRGLEELRQVLRGRARGAPREEHPRGEPLLRGQQAGHREGPVGALAPPAASLLDARQPQRQASARWASQGPRAARHVGQTQHPPAPERPDRPWTDRRPTTSTP